MEKTIIGLAELTVLPPARQRLILPKVLHLIMSEVATGIGDPLWLGVDKPS